MDPFFNTTNKRCGVVTHTQILSRTGRSVQCFCTVPPASSLLVLAQIVSYSIHLSALDLTAVHDLDILAKATETQHPKNEPPRRKGGVQGLLGGKARKRESLHKGKSANSRAVARHRRCELNLIAPHACRTAIDYTSTMPRSRVIAQKPSHTPGTARRSNESIY